MESLRQSPKAEINQSQFLKAYFPEIFADSRFQRILLDQQSCKTSLDVSNISSVCVFIFIM